MSNNTAKDIIGHERPASDVPTLEEFNPQVVPYQMEVINDVFSHNYVDDGKLELLLSGSIGSAKTLLMAHIIVVACLEYEGLECGIGRVTLPDVKSTLFKMILDHLADLREGTDYWYSEPSGIIRFSNGSSIKCFSWKDKRYSKFRSYPFAIFVIEELTENLTNDAYEEIKMRVGRQTHIPFALLMCATNPDEPDHWAYEYFIANTTNNPNIKVYYSRSEDNKTLPKWYIPSLKKTMSPLMAKRMLEGQWIRIAAQAIYHAFDENVNVIDSYEFKDTRALQLAFDFNIGKGKPMSCALSQEDEQGNEFVFDEVILPGMRTKNVLEEIDARGWFDLAKEVRIYGDRDGSSNDTRGTKTDYDIIVKFIEGLDRPEGLSDFKKDESLFLKIPKSNPPVRKRHNLVNAGFNNDLGESSIFIVKSCKKTIKGFKLTALVKGGKYIEDDSKDYQHVTTAFGYQIVQKRRRQQSAARSQ